MNTLKIGDNILDLSQPCVMGILNLTSDSFYDGGRYLKLDSAMRRADEMLTHGAKIIDVGGFSSRPKADFISVSEELDRLLPVIIELKRQFPSINLSVDTYRSEVVERISEITPFLVNDITAGSLDEKLFETIGRFELPYVLMHMKGIPKNMQEMAQYENICFELLDFFAIKIAQVKKHNINQVIVDPGFGFGKSLTHNFEVLKSLGLFNIFELPVMIGLSRKSMIYKSLATTAEHALNGTTALHMTALMKGARILRVHDVKEAVETVHLFRQMEIH